jgi:uncharacterized membrane-anchored protein
MSNTMSARSEFLTVIAAVGVGLIAFLLVFLLAAFIPLLSVPEWVPVVAGVVVGARYLTSHR